MYFDRFDVCEAFYCYASLYHGGQFTGTYRIFGRLERIKFRGCSQGDPDRLEENAREIFDSLVARGGFDPYTAD